MEDPEMPRDDSSLTAWLDENAINVAGGDFAALAEIIGDARVVAIGESAHGVHEFYELKDQLLRYLVSELGFSAFVMESGLPEGLSVDDWAVGGEGELKDLLHAGITYRMGGNEEMRTQLEWMRSWNETHPERHVRFYGMDIPGSAVDGRPALAAVLQFVEPIDAEFARRVRADAERPLGWLDGLDGPAAVLGGYAQLDAETRDALGEFASKLVDEIEARRAGYAAKTNDEAVERIHRSAVVLHQWAGFLAGMATGAGARDAAMAENVAWILEREERIAIGAHNGHVQRVPLGPPYPAMTPLGQHLAGKLGDDLFVIGTTMKSGKVANHRKTGPGPVDIEMFLDDLPLPEPSTIDALLAARGKGTYAVDLRRVPTTGPVADRFARATTIRVNHAPVPVEPLKAFDALVHFDGVTPVDRIEQSTGGS